jgi:DNA-binding SARP family transcriptional activator
MPGWVLVVAATGWGKTAALAAGGDRAVWLDPADTALPAAAARVVVDDLDRVPAAELRRLLRRLSRLPAGSRVWLASRRPLGPAARAAMTGPVREVGPADLALSRTAVAAALGERGVDDEAAATAHDTTAGWPALVGLPATEVSRWVHEQLLPTLAPRAVRLLAALADLDLVTRAVAAHLADLLPDAAALDDLIRIGLLSPHPRAGWPPDPCAYRVVPAVAHALAPAPAPAPDLLRAAARWYEDNDHPLAAARALHRAGDHAACRALITARGDDILATGAAPDIVHLLEPGAIGDRLALIHGDALRMSGDVAGALRVFAPLLAGPGPYDPGLAWRAGMAHYLAGDFPAALTTYEQAAETGAPADLVRLAAGRASALAWAGENEAAAAQSSRAITLATEAGDDRATAAAHIAAGVTAVGARQEDHLTAGLAAARRAGDVVQAARALVNLTDGLLRDARYPQALEVAQRALAAAEVGGPPGVLVTALHNLGEALTKLGRYAEAARHQERSVRCSRRFGLGRTALGLAGLADLHWRLGQREQSRTAYAEAVDVARAADQPQVLALALAGLARVLAEDPGADLPAATALAEEADKLATGPRRSAALTARGWVALRAGDLPAATALGTDAVAAARAGRAVDGLAEALELAGAATADPARARGALAEALAIWRRSGALPAADRVLVLLGRLPGADGTTRAAARDAATRMSTVDTLPADGAAAPVRIRVLGGFEVWVGGQPVPLNAWRSKQARTLVKVLVARRGRPVPRPELCELLWPDDDPARTGHRLSVLLSAVRTVLDPQRLWPPDRYLRADPAGASLDLRHAAVDTEVLLRDAAHGADLLRCGQSTEAGSVLSEVDASYRGDAFDEDPYEDWADPLREQVRAAWLRGLRALAELGDADHSVGCLVRLLAADPYDEPAHRRLVAVLSGAGRHGEARRALDRWTRAMRDIGAPAPAPALPGRAPAVLTPY